MLQPLRILALSGWGQPHDALSDLAPNARHVDYARHSSAHAALLDIKAHNPEPDILLGWSLGGQLAVRSVADGLIRPRKLVLIATPFQFVKNPKLPLGMPRDVFDTFRDNYSNAPERTLRKAWELIALDDTQAGTVRSHLSKQDKQTVLAKDWLQWLNILETFSCDGLHMADFPPTTLIHGEADLVVHHEQVLGFCERIPHAKLWSLAGCGHAPHWHDADLVKQVMYE